MLPARPTLIATAAALALWGSPLATIAQPASAAAPATVVTRDNDNLWTLGNTHAAGSRHSRQQWMVAVLRRNPDAFLLGNIHRLRSQATLQLPTDAEVAQENLAAAEALLERHAAALDGNQAMPVLPRLSPAPAAPVPAPASPAAAAAPAASAPVGGAPSAPATAAPTPASPAAPTAAATEASAAGASPAAPARAEAGPPSTTPRTTVSDAPAATAAPAGESWHRWLPHGMAALLALTALGLVWRSRQAGVPLGRSVSTLFQDTIQLVQRSRPRRVTVSTAGADIARSVERLAATDQLVASDRVAVADIDVTAVPQEPSMKLALARAQIEVGRTEAAIAMLRAVLREGASAEREAAERLLARLGTA